MADPANTARAADTPFIATVTSPAPFGFLAGPLDEGGSASSGIDAETFRGGGDRGDDSGLAREAVEEITGFAWEEDIRAGIDADLMSPGGVARLTSGFLGTAGELDALGGAGLVAASPAFVGLVAGTAPTVGLAAIVGFVVGTAFEELGLLPDDGVDLLADTGVDAVEDGVSSDGRGRVRSRSPAVVFPAASFFLLSSIGSPTTSNTFDDTAPFSLTFLAG